MSPDRATLIGKVMSLAESPYLSALSQYGSFAGSTGSLGLARMAPYAPIYTGNSPTSGNNTVNATKWDVQAVINQLISQGAVPPPFSKTGVPGGPVHPLDAVVYVVFVPNTSVSYCGSNGCNDYIVNAYGSDDYVEVSVNLADAGPSLSHELAEAMTNYMAIGVSNCTNAGQVADVCCSLETQGGVRVQSYWSAIDQACVIPESWGDLTEYAGSASGWVVPSGGFPMRAVHGGNAGVVATGTDDLPRYFSASTGWSKDSSGNAAPLGTLPFSNGAQYALGNGLVASVPLGTAKGVYTYDTTQGISGVWGQLPAFGGPVTSVTVTGAGAVVVTDTNAFPWYYNGSSWVLMALMRADHIVASGANVLVLDDTRTRIWQFSGSNLGASPTNMATYSVPIASLVASPASTNYGVVLAGGGLVPSGTSGSGVAGWNYAITGNSSTATFVALVFPQSPSQEFSAHTCDGNASCSSQSGWYSLTQGLGRLVSSNVIYGTQCTFNSWGCIGY